MKDISDFGEPISLLRIFKEATQALKVFEVTALSDKLKGLFTALPTHFPNMKKIGIIYSTVDGHTKKISDFLAAQFKREDNQVLESSLSDFTEKISEFDILLIGASIRYGKHSDQFLQFINDNVNELKTVRTAFFSVNLVARNTDKNKPDTNPYVIKFMETIDWEPDLVEVFAGCLDYSKYRFFDNLMIKLIMIFSGGPFTTKEPIEYTDWERVREFGEKVITLNHEKSRKTSDRFLV